MQHDRQLNAGAEHRRPPFSVVIPACNEEAVIARCLDAIVADAPADARPEIVVVCNACRDATAERARACEGVTVVELAVGSKPLALNTGNRAASASPRFFVDADVVVGYQALAATAEILRTSDVRAAAPRLKVDDSRSTWPVRRYYTVWRALPYVADAMVGSGVYGLSEQGLASLGEFPDIIADDNYVRLRFAPAERRSVAVDRDGRPLEFTVYPPRTVRDLIRVEARRRAGDAQLRALLPQARTLRDTTWRSLTSGLFTRFGPLDLVIYLSIKAAGRLRFRLMRAGGAGSVWLRDESSRREPEASPRGRVCGAAEPDHRKRNRHLRRAFRARSPRNLKDRSP